MTLLALKINNFGIEELLFDPQTSGGLLYSIDKKESQSALAALKELGLPCNIVGEVKEKATYEIVVV